MYNGSFKFPLNIFDWRKYNTPVNLESSITIATAGTYQTVLSQTGQGYFTKILIGGHATNIPKLRITIDGVVVFYSKNNVSGANYSGILLESFLADEAGTWKIRASNAFTSAQVTTVTLKSYPCNDDTVNAVVLLPQPIFFNTSLLVEITNTTNNGQAVTYMYSGGVAS